MTISEEHVNAVKSILLDRLHERSFLPGVVGLDAQRKMLYNTLRYTVENGTSNSVLLIGARGTGKSMVTEKVLGQLNEQCMQSMETPQFQAASGARIPFHVVRLNGFIHTDDRIALQEIAKQLKCVDDVIDVKFHTFNDCLSYILRLLRYVPTGVSQHDNNEPEQTELPILHDDYDDDFDASKIQLNPNRSSSVIFILEEFDLFTTRYKQTLLYNLFDIVQSTKDPPVAVIGMTTRLDATDFLEKRIRSRFSQRKILFTRPSTVEEFTAIAELALSIPLNSPSIPKEYIDKFNSSVTDFLNGIQTTIIHRLYHISKDIRLLFHSFIPFILSLSTIHPTISTSTNAANVIVEDTKVSMMLGISILELSLLIAMKRLSERDLLHFTFEMMYDEYRQFAAKCGADPHPKSVAMKAFEQLISLECVLPVDANGILLWTGCAGTTGGTSSIGVNTSFSAGSSISTNIPSAAIRQGPRHVGGHGTLMYNNLQGAPKEFRMMRLALEKEQIHDLIRNYHECPTHIKKWGLSWLE